MIAMIKLKKFKKKSLTSPWFWLPLAALLLVIGIVVTLLLTVFADLPSPKKLETQAYPVSTQIFDRQGTLLYEIYADTRRNPVPLSSLPPFIAQATVAIEDQNFNHHFGFSIQ